MSLESSRLSARPSPLQLRLSHALTHSRGFESRLSSNFSPKQIDALLADKGATVPTVNQLPCTALRLEPTWLPRCPYRNLFASRRARRRGIQRLLLRPRRRGAITADHWKQERAESRRNASQCAASRVPQIVAENRKRGVAVQAWSPLGRALRGRNRDACAEIGKRYGKSAAQVALKWIEATGCSYTTQTKTRSHFEEDIDIFDFSLSKEEVATLAAL